MDEDVFLKKTIIFNFWKHQLKLKTSQDLFSSDEVDLGTQFLLRTIVEGDYPEPRKILDIGCGYGPLGLTLKSLYEDSSVHLCDKDALAIEYTRQNAKLNRLAGTEVYGSLGYDDVKNTDFDLIVSNIPGKAGGPVIEYLLREAVRYLVPGGLVGVVVVDPLEKTVEQVLQNSTGVNLILKRSRPGHVVFHYRFTDYPRIHETHQSSLEREVYHRNNIQVRVDKLTFPMQTAYGLPEFDTLHYRSEMLINALRNIRITNVNLAAMFNPGQGHVAVALWELFHPENIMLVDRDLLALGYSKLNLLSNRCPAERVRTFHQVGIDLNHESGVDLLTVVLREEEGQKAMLLNLQQAVGSLSAAGVLAVSGSSTSITRLMTYARMQSLLRIRAREKWRGCSLLILDRSLP